MNKVYLVGAGPGDAGLLTIKAKELIERADVIVFDRLADESILEFARSTAEKIYVGKAAGAHSMKQDEINRLLVEKALESEKKDRGDGEARSETVCGDDETRAETVRGDGELRSENDRGSGELRSENVRGGELRAENIRGDDKIIVRLKGGDPFVFGRGGEEALVLREHSIPFEIVPGVTSAIAVAAYAGIPVTHRGVATSFAVVTGHEMNDERSNIRWDKLSTGVDTLVFLMGVGNLARITARLIENGRDQNTPAALVRCGTRVNQSTLISTLGRIADDVQRLNITPPAILIVGEVVRLRERLKWFETRPLFGKKIVVTRARSQASELSKRLIELGARVIECPTIEIVAPADHFSSLDFAIGSLSTFDLIVFTSVNGVEKFFDRLSKQKKDARSIRGKIAAIGSSTARALEAHGIIADFVPNEFRAEALVELLKDRVEGKKILIARAEEARELLPHELRKFGAEVEVAAAYRTISTVDRRIDLDGADWITFTSSSTVKNFVKSFGADRLSSIKTAAIGPITASTLREFGLEPTVVAREYTIDGLIEALIEEEFKHGR